MNKPLPALSAELDAAEVTSEHIGFVFLKLHAFLLILFISDVSAQYAEQGLCVGRASVLQFVRMSLLSIDSNNGGRQVCC